MKPAIAVALTAGFSPLARAQSAALLCQSQTQPCPIKSQYPTDITGVVNGTIAILPIPYATARSLVPAQYGILNKSIKALIPGFPEGMFPAYLDAVHDHDIGELNATIPDFSRASITLPFVDRLNDGYTSMAFSLPFLLTATNAVALAGSDEYENTLPGNFTPPCDGYASNGQGSTFFTGYVASAAVDSTPAFNTTFHPRQGNPYSIDVFKNITNQPIFGSNLPLCDQYIRLFNTSVTTGKYAPTSVQGTVGVTSPFYAENTTFHGVWGYRLANSFIEMSSQQCSSLQAYHGTGPGD